MVRLRRAKLKVLQLGKVHRARFGFSQAHIIGKTGITANFVFPFVQSYALFAPCDVSKCKIRYQWM